MPYYDLLISAEIADEALDKAMLRCIGGGKMLGAQWTAYHPRSAVNDNYSPRKSMELARNALEPLEMDEKQGTNARVKMYSDVSEETLTQYNEKIREAAKKLANPHSNSYVTVMSLKGYLWMNDYLKAVLGMNIDKLKLADDIDHWQNAFTVYWMKHSKASGLYKIQNFLTKIADELRY